MLVVDASVLAVALADDAKDGDQARARLRAETLAAPELVDLEVGSVLRRQVRVNRLTERRAAQAMLDLALLPLRRSAHLPFLGRCWELRENLTMYDAVYVALAEALVVPLITADVRLSKAAGPRCTIEVLSPGH